MPIGHLGKNAATLLVTTVRSNRHWFTAVCRHRVTDQSTWEDSNLRSPAPQTGALTAGPQVEAVDPESAYAVQPGINLVWMVGLEPTTSPVRREYAKPTAPHPVVTGPDFLHGGRPGSTVQSEWGESNSRCSCSQSRCHTIRRHSVAARLSVLSRLVKDGVPASADPGNRTLHAIRMKDSCVPSAVGPIMCPLTYPLIGTGSSLLQSAVRQSPVDRSHISERLPGIEPGYPGWKPGTLAMLVPAA